MPPGTCASDLLPIPFLEPPKLSADVSVDISSSYASTGASTLPCIVYFIPVPCVSHCLVVVLAQCLWVSSWFCVALGVVRDGCVRRERGGSFGRWTSETFVFSVGSWGVCTGSVHWQQHHSCAGKLLSKMLHPAQDSQCPPSLMMLVEATLVLERRKCLFTIFVLEFSLCFVRRDATFIEARLDVS